MRGVSKLSFTHTYENSATTIAPVGFECYKKFRKDLGFEETITYGNGILLLFYGTPPGSPDSFLNSFFNSFTNCFCLLFISKLLKKKYKGTSGTGKTMMANALGNKLGKRILLINFTSLGGNQADEVIKFIFREAKLTYDTTNDTTHTTHTTRHTLIGYCVNAQGLDLVLR